MQTGSSGNHTRYVRSAALVLTAAVAAVAAVPHAPRAQSAAAALAATAHPPLPIDPAHYWLVADLTALPARAPQSPAGRLAQGVRLVADGRFEDALPLVRTTGLERSALVPYARYYEGVALLGLGRHEEAAAVLGTAAPTADSALKEHVDLRLAEAALATGDHARAKQLLADLAGRPPALLGEPAEVLLRLAQAEEAAGHDDHRLDAYRRLYYEYPTSEQAAAAREAIERLGAGAVGPETSARALARAGRLFAARDWTAARAAFDAVAPHAAGGDRTLVALRLAQCDYELGRHRAARDALRPLLDDARHGAEARYYSLLSARALRERATYVTLVRRLADDHPESDWAAEALYGLASYYVADAGDDAEADRVYRELYRRFPSHRHAERAAWRIGWRAYKAGRYAETAALFDEAAARFPRSDHRPQWLYWAGRAYERLDQPATAHDRYRLTVADYQNLYHGRRAARILEARRQPPVAPQVTLAAAEPASPIRTAPVVRDLAAAGLYEDALREVHRARRQWGDSPQVQATIAWLLHHQAFELTATGRFDALRGSITTMRRAYPQFMAAGGESLPPDVLRIIFPLDYWPLIESHAAQHRLDPYLMAALVAQESTFTAEIRSAANAIGLMQIIPATGRRYAQRLGIRNFSTDMLTQPETNVRIGMQYFRDLMTRFGAAHLALAGYNAGETRVDRWLRERPGMAEEEFIEDIPFAETQAYVKRILGSADDYRRLYGSGILDPNGRVAATARR